MYCGHCALNCCLIRENLFYNIINILSFFLFVSVALPRAALCRYRFSAKRYHLTGRSNSMKTVSFEEQGYITSHTCESLLPCNSCEYIRSGTMRWICEILVGGIFAHANQSNTKPGTNRVFSYFEEIRIYGTKIYLIFYKYK